MMAPDIKMIHHLLPHVVPVLVLDVLRHVLEDQPVHLGAGGPLWFAVQTRREPSYDPPQKLGHCWWFCKDRGRQSSLWDPFIEKVGDSAAREGTLRARWHVHCPAIHSR